MYIRISGRFTSQISVLTGSENLGNYNTVASARVVVNIGVVISNMRFQFLQVML